MTDILNVLSQELKLLDEAGRVVSYSFNKCKKIGVKNKYSDEELESFAVKSVQIYKKVH